MPGRSIPGPLNQDEKPVDTRDGTSPLSSGSTANPTGWDAGLLADAEPQKAGKKGGGKKGGTKKGAVEINIVATFENPFEDQNAEVEAMKAGRWEPSTDDFVAVAGGKSLQVSDFIQVLGVIVTEGDGERPEKSIRRINIFSHSNPDLIAFEGNLVSSPLRMDVELIVSTGLSVERLAELRKPGSFFEIQTKKKRTFTLADVRKRFTDDAVIVLYSCKSGADQTFLTDIANTLDVDVLGFSKNITYCPTYEENPNRVTNRKRVGIANCSQPSPDFHTLDADGSAIKVSPSP